MVPAGTVAGLLADARTGLADPATFKVAGYDDRLRLESVIPPFIGATTAAGFGGVVRASFGATFGDVLRDRQLQTIFRAGTDRDDFAAQFAYVNRKGQWNWGVTGGFMPSRFVGARRSIAREGELITRETTHLRYLHQWGGVTARYNMNRAQRFELSAGARRTGFTWQHITRVMADQELVSRERDEAAGGRPVYLGELRAAFVHDTAIGGATSPFSASGSGSRSSRRLAASRSRTCAWTRAGTSCRFGRSRLRRASSTSVATGRMPAIHG